MTIKKAGLQQEERDLAQRITTQIYHPLALQIQNLLKCFRGDLIDMGS